MSLSCVFTWNPEIKSLWYTSSPFQFVGSSLNSVLWVRMPRERPLAAFPLPNSSVWTFTAEVIIFKSSQFHGGTQGVREAEIGHLPLTSKKEKGNWSWCCQTSLKAGFCSRRCQRWGTTSVVLWQHSTNCYLHIGHIIRSSMKNLIRSLKLIAGNS